MLLSNSSRLKGLTRRTLWVGKQILWNQFFPVAAHITGAAISGVVRSKLSQVSSPLISGRLLRLQTPDGAIIGGLTPVTAWAKYALPKGLPIDKPVLAIENEPHFVDDFSGDISSGYGAGTKTLLLSDNVVLKIGGRSSVQKLNYHVHKTQRSGGREHYDFVVTGVPSGARQWEVNIPRGTFKGRYAFIQLKDSNGILTRMKDQGIRIPKPIYTLRKEEVLSAIEPGKVIVERKIDGSLGNAHVQGQRVAFRSHREGGETYYDRLPTVEFLRNESSFYTSRLLYPGPSLTGTVFQGELAHEDGAARVSGILNSLPQNARAIQQVRGPVRYYVWDILRYKGRDVSGKTYAERRALCEQLVAEIRRVNKYWDIVEKAESESPREFYDRITKDPLPWGEGVVVKPKDQMVQKWDKVKMTGFGYFKLVGVLPGTDGKYGQSVGRLLVENPANGARGEVGSLAVPDDFRKWMWNHRDQLIGEVVKVRSQEVTSRGVPRAGVFFGFHDSDVDLLMQSESLAGIPPANPGRGRRVVR